MRILVEKDVAVDLLAKAHVKGFTTNKGTFVQEHEDSRSSKKFGPKGFSRADAGIHHMDSEKSLRDEGFKVTKREGGSVGKIEDRKFGKLDGDTKHDIHFKHSDGRTAKLTWDEGKDGVTVGLERGKKGGVQNGSDKKVPGTNVDKGSVKHETAEEAGKWFRDSVKDLDDKGYDYKGSNGNQSIFEHPKHGKVTLDHLHAGTSTTMFTSAATGKKQPYTSYGGANQIFSTINHYPKK